MIRRTTPWDFNSTPTAVLTLLLFGLLVSPAFSASSIQLTWDANTESDLAGYKIYKRAFPSQDFGQPVFSGMPSNPSSPSTTVSGLSGGTTYGFIATAFDTTGNESAPATEVPITLPTSPPPAPPPPSSPPPADTTAPTVTLTAPSAGTVSGTVTVRATASDNVGVTGVQFRLQGANLGPEDTSSPYSTSWDTTTMPNGAYTLSALARDAAGNTTTAAPRTVTVSNSTTSPTSPSSGLNISNLAVASGQTYVVPTSGLQAGGTVYIDRAFTFTTVPASLQGAAYIRTANDDKPATTSAFLSFTVNQPVSVSVAHDVRITPKPSWLTTFTDTGTNLVTTDTTLRLFVRSFPAGTITLGGNAGDGYSMYSVLVQPQDGSAPTLDTTPPPVPSELEATSLSTTEIRLSWTASKDDAGVTGYDVARNSVVIGQSITNAFVDITASPGMTYQYTVRARDASGNVSAWSAPLYFTTSQVMPQLEVFVSGSGSVVSTPNGIHCPRRSCTASYPNETMVTLTPKSRKGWTFSGWSGSCHGTGACSLKLNENRTVNANFLKNVK